MVNILFMQGGKNVGATKFISVLPRIGDTVRIPTGEFKVENVVFDYTSFYSCTVYIHIGG